MTFYYESINMNISLVRLNVEVNLTEFLLNAKFLFGPHELNLNNFLNNVNYKAPSLNWALSSRS